jgi:hypothetical protein
MRAGVEKLITPEWWTGGVLHDFLREQHTDALPFFRPVMDHAIAPGAIPVSTAVVAMQIGCGLALASGRHLRPALICAVAMNVTFVLAGRVNPSAFYLVMEFVLIMAVAEGAVGTSRPWPARRVAISAVGLFGSALVLLPFVRTLKPSDVIEDPATVLVTVLVLSGIALSLAALFAHPSTSLLGKRMPAILDWLHVAPKPRPDLAQLTGALAPPSNRARTDNWALPDRTSGVRAVPPVSGHAVKTTPSFPPPVLLRR